ncbi:MAG: adenosylcobinamide-GDP ribazoletransferase [Proteobacteria bacterium]|nr:adenosylcobinamide-GDP ribazoletransferase [Pseudomonadota bacterium]
MIALLRRFLIALQFMTVFRVQDNLAETEADLAASIGFYPLVGLFLGGLLAGGSILFSMLFPPPVTGLLLVLALAVFTHGLHLDGLADTADAMFSHRDRSGKLIIMKDSAVGVFGAAALVFVLGLKILLLTELAWPGARFVLLLFPVWGRWAVSLTACLSSYARQEGGLGRPFVDLAGASELYPAGLVTLVLSALGGLPALAAMLTVTLASLAGVWLWRRLLGGVTGDILGASAEVGECLGLLTALAFF